MTGKILLYEELSQNAHPAVHTQLYDGWVLRYSKGHRENRINSVNPLYPSSMDPGEKIAECEARYSLWGMRTVFKLTEATDPDIDKALDTLGYAVVTPTLVMEMGLGGKTSPPGDCILTDKADGAWLKAYAALSDTASRQAADPERIFGGIRNEALYGRIENGGATVACGSAVFERGYMALLNVVVDRPERGKGYGRGICESLLAAAARRGSHTAYLQVVRDNDVAVSLYTKLGYKAVYAYWYRAKG
jgi:GNAT superfamily N-acetyltransferase